MLEKFWLGLWMFRTWKQQKITMSFLCLLLQKYVPIPSSCIRTFVDFLIHDNIELRKVGEEIGVKFFLFDWFSMPQKVLQQFVVCKNHRESSWKNLSMKFVVLRLFLIRVIIYGSQSMVINHQKHKSNGKKLVFWINHFMDITPGQKWSNIP